METYADSYNQSLRLDRIPGKRSQKLQCKPGFVQRGAACQKITNGGAKSKGKKLGATSEGGGAKNLLLTAAAVGISAAAVGVAIKQNPQLVQQVEQKAKDFLGAMNKADTNKLPKEAIAIADKTGQAIDKKIGGKPNKFQQLGKEVAMEVASKAVGVVVGDAVANRVAIGRFMGGASSGDAMFSGLFSGLVVGRAARMATRKGLYAAFGESGLSSNSKENIRSALDVAYIGALFAAQSASRRSQSNSSRQVDDVPFTESTEDPLRRSSRSSSRR